METMGTRVQESKSNKTESAKTAKKCYKNLSGFIWDQDAASSSLATRTKAGSFHYENCRLFLVYSGSILGFRMLIFSFFSRKRYATRDTILSNALPIPNNKAIPVSVGFQTFVA